MKAHHWQVLIADLKSSRRIPERERPRVDQALVRAITRVRACYAVHFRLAPEVLKGDELQAVLRPAAPALTILTHLRAQLATEVGARAELRAGLGAGTILRLSPRGPFASEGAAFHRARMALDGARAAGGTRMTGWVVGDSFFDPMADAVLGLMDAVVTRWTDAQWEAVVGRLESKGLHAIARDAGVRFQPVSKRLRTASWSEVLQTMRLLERMAEAGLPKPRTAGTPRARHSPLRG